MSAVPVKDLPVAAWRRATHPATRVVVKPDLTSQQQATALLAAGHCGWRDIHGKLRAVGVPKSHADRGRVWAP